MCPTLRRKLKHGTFDLTACRWNISASKSNTKTFQVNWCVSSSIYIYLMLAHLYSLISKILQSFRPHHIPKPLQSNTSNINASHQHSMKFGSKCANAISVTSHITDMAHNMPKCRISRAYRRQAKIIARTLMPICKHLLWTSIRENDPMQRRRHVTKHVRM